MHPTPPPDLVDPAGMVIADCLCRRCGYNLRGLNQNGRCPECATPVGRSTLGDLLKYSDPAWLDTLKTGANLILSGVLFGMLGNCVVSAAQVQNTPIGGLIQIAVGLIGLVGAWKLTTPDPSQIGEDMYGQARKIVRLTLLIGLAGSFLPLLLAANMSTPLIVLLVLVAAVAVLAGAVGQFYQLTYISRLAVRIPDMLISSRAALLRWAFVGCWALLTIAGIGIAALGFSVPQPVAPRPAVSGLIGALAIVAAIIGVFMLIFSIMYILMLNRLRKALTHEAVVARELWNATPNA